MISLAAVIVFVAHRELVRYQWTRPRTYLQNWAAKLNRERNRCDSTHVSVNGRNYVIATAKVTVVNDATDFRYIYDGEPVDANRFFIAPPGIWVRTIDEAIDIWTSTSN
jgi:hypothetical protein